MAKNKVKETPENESDDIIVAEKGKGGERTTFSRLAWRMMGKDKNGWLEVTDGDAAVQAAEEIEKSTINVNAEIETEKKYKQLIADGAQAKKVNNLSLELTHLLAANEIKQTPKTTDRIAAIKKAIEKTGNDDIFNQFVTDGDKAVTDGDFGTAYEMFSGALEVREDADVRAKLNSADAELKKEK